MAFNHSFESNAVMEVRLRSRGGKGLLFMAAISFLFAARASAADILVYNNNDSGPGSLRQAITDNNASGLNTIVRFNDALAASHPNSIRREKFQQLDPLTIAQ